MATKAIVCLLSVSLANALYPNPSVSSSLSSNLINLSNSPNPSSLLSSIGNIRSSTNEWNKEFDFAKLGLQIKLKYANPAAPLEGTHMVVEFKVPELLTVFTMGVTDVELNIFLTAPKIEQGLFDVKIGYNIVRNATPIEGTIQMYRTMEKGKYITKLVVNDKTVPIVDVVIDADMKNKCLITATVGLESYNIRINRVRGNSWIVATVYGGHEYTTVINPNYMTKTIEIVTSVDKEIKHQCEVVYNPISTEVAVYVSGNVLGPIDFRVVVQRDLKFAQIVVSHNKINYLYLNLEGKALMNSMIPEYLKYDVTYDILNGLYGEGRAKMSLNTFDTEKTLSVSIVPKNWHSYDFELKSKFDADYSFEITHELMSNKEILYTATHKHTVAFNNEEKWMSLQKDKCVIPKTSPLTSLLKDTYILTLLSNMQRKMAINIDWKSSTGVVPMIDYKDTTVTEGVKHFVVAVNTMKTPFTFHITYPRGPTVRNMNLGLVSLIGRDAFNCQITYAPSNEIEIVTDIDNTKLKITLPNAAMKTLFVIEVTTTQKNEEALKLALYKNGPMAFKVNGFASLTTPEIPMLCTSAKNSCKWSATANVDVDFEEIIAGLVPVNVVAISVTRDYETLIELQQSFKTSPYFVRINCPMVLPKMINVEINHVANKEMTIKIADYIPGNVVVEIVGSEHTVKYEGHELVRLDINIPMKTYSVYLAFLTEPICVVKYTTTEFLKNNVDFTLNLPVLGDVVAVKAAWNLVTLLKPTVKVNTVVTLPVVGVVDNTAEVVAELTYPQGMFKVVYDLVCTKGLLTFIPPVNVEVTTTFSFVPKELTCRAATVINKKTVAIYTSNTDFSFVNYLI